MKSKRWHAHDRVEFNMHTGSPDRGEFLGYDRAPKGWCRVFLYRAGLKVVPVESLTRPARRMERVA